MKNLQKVISAAIFMSFFFSSISLDAQKYTDKKGQSKYDRSGSNSKDKNTQKSSVYQSKTKIILKADQQLPSDSLSPIYTDRYIPSCFNTIKLSPAMSSGFTINRITLLKFPNADLSGEPYDESDDFPDAYFELLDGNESDIIGVSEVMHNARPNRRFYYKGMDMPFRIEKGKSYKLLMKDYDPSGINPDDPMTSEIPINFNTLSRAGYPNELVMSCTRNPKVSFKVHVEYVWSKAHIQGKAKYLTQVKPISQNYINNTRPFVLEGCGPVAAAMVLSYWQKVKGYRIMNSNDRNYKTHHPTHTIREFYDAAPAAEAPLQSSDRRMSYTLKLSMKNGLQSFCDKANQSRGRLPELDAQIDRRVRAESYKMEDLRESLLREEPVIIMLVGIPPGLRTVKDDFAWASGRHYVVAVGFDDIKEEIYVLTGWGEKAIDFAKGPMSHSREDGVLGIISYKEFDKADPSLLWIRQIDGSK